MISIIAGPADPQETCRTAMRLLQRYILWELLKVFGCVLSALTVLLVFVGIFREVSENGLGPLQILQILPFLVPSLMPFTIPATFLLTVCVVYGRVAGDQEITAAKAAGINVISLLWPSFVLGGVLSICSLVLADRVIPWAMDNIQRKVTLAMEDIFLDVLRTKHVVKDDRLGYSITVLGVEDKRLIMPTFIYTPEGRSAVTVQARQATMQFDLQNQEVILHLQDGYIDSAGEKVWVENETQAFPMPLQMKKAKPRHRSISDIGVELRHVSQRVEMTRRRRDVEVALALAEGDFQRLLDDELNIYNRSYDYRQNALAKLNTEVHSRFALSASCLLFTLLGGPFSILKARRQFLTNFMTCFLPILLVYYPLVLLMINLSKTGDVQPWWATWVGNAIVVVVACVIIRKVLRH